MSTRAKADIPAQAGILQSLSRIRSEIPACAGMTIVGADLPGVNA